MMIMIIIIIIIIIVIIIIIIIIIIMIIIVIKSCLYDASLKESLQFIPIWSGPFFWVPGPRVGGWGRKVPPAHIAKTIEHIGMKLGGLAENYKLINFV